MMSMTIDLCYRVIRSFFDTDQHGGLIVSNKYDNVMHIFVVAILLRAMIIRWL